MNHNSDNFARVFTQAENSTRCTERRVAVTAEFIELRRRSANSSIVITRLTTCGRTSFHRELGRGSAIEHRLYPIQDASRGGSSISASLDYPGMIRERRASKIPRISAAIRELISTCSPCDSIDPRRRYFPSIFPCRRYREGGGGNRVLRASIISHRSPSKRDRSGKIREKWRLHQPLCWIIHQEANILVVAGSSTPRAKIRMKFRVRAQTRNIVFK